MPWCEGCNRYLSPPTVTAKGSCPTCGRGVAAVAGESPARAPWHFKLLVGAAAAYLLMRAVQGLAWLAERAG